MSAENKRVAQQFYDVINDWNPERLAELCSPALRGHAGAGTDLADLTSAISGFTEAFADLTATPRALVAEDDMVSTWVTYTGTHSGRFAGIEGSGRTVKFAAWDLIRVDESGRICEITQYCDLFTLMNQIGALPTTAPA